MELSKEIKKEIEAIAMSMGQSPEEVERAISSLCSAHGYSIEGALAVYKSVHKRELSGVRGVYRIIVLHVGQKNTVTGQDGKPDAVVVHVIGMCNALKGDDYYLMDLSLWSTPSDPTRVDRTKIAETLEVEKVYEFEGSYNPTTKKMSVLGKEFKHVPLSVDLKALLSGVNCIPLASAEDRINETGFYTGYIGRVYNTPDSGMVEISDALATPLPCWFNGTTFDEKALMGRRCLILATSSKPKDKDVRLNGKAFYLLD